MNLYKISQTTNNDYDTYDSAVVVAESIEHAQNMHPSGSQDAWGNFSWVRRKSDVTVEFLGETHLVESYVVCASFNAG
jgi:hypothetical protein